MERQEEKRTDINDLGEFGLIDHLTFDAIIKQPTTVMGIGDDAAVIDSGDYYTLVSTDMLIEGIHFDLMYTPLKHLGYKAVIVNLSDIYAMNGHPTQITVSLAISNRFSVQALEELYAGIHLACDLYNVDLVGGDTTSSQKGLILSITALGQVEKEKISYRRGAKEGDIVCATGSFGGAYLGLQVLEREKQIFKEHPDLQPELNEHEFMIGRLLKPEARRDAILYLDSKGVVPSSMIDVSDGLSSELFHLAKQSEVGFIIEEDLVPIHIDTKKLAIDFGIDPITCALHGGEDYELLFTIQEKDLEAIRIMPDVSIIGEVVNRSEGLNLVTQSGNRHALSAQGWAHFGQ